ncbi:hypothetical protein, partial [Salmonella enterica]|uniref:hypothetical protein n=1 Tax=Salmonella enterica TaxID=28901 RepID=UPI003CE83389
GRPEKFVRHDAQIKEKNRTENWTGKGQEKDGMKRNNSSRYDAGNVPNAEPGEQSPVYRLLRPRAAQSRRIPHVIARRLYFSAAGA